MVVPNPSPLYTFDYVPSGKTYTVILRTKSSALGRAFSSCAHIFFGTVDEAKARSVVYPTQIFETEQRFYFSPSVGIYLIPINPGHGFSQRFRTYAPPTKDPTEPFKVNESALCTNEVRPTAQTMLSELKAYFADPHGSVATPSWVIVPHKTIAGTYYELRSDETIMISAMFTCAHVTAISPQELAIRKLGGSKLPSLNYSQQLGIYVVQ